MTKIACLLLLLTLLAAPAAAQDDLSPLVWIPADFSGFVRLDMHNPVDTINQLNLSAYIASRIQRQRATYSGFPDFSDFFPLDVLDTENVTFESQVLPWVQGEIVLAYRRFDSSFGVAPEDALLILPTSSPFIAAGFLSVVTHNQDFPEHESYRDTLIYSGDQTAIAFTPGAVLIGVVPTLKEALDAGLGGEDRLIDDAAFQSLSAAAEDPAVISAYLGAEAANRAISVALQGSTSSQSLLSVLGEALAQQEAGGLEQIALSGNLDGLALNLDADTLRQVLNVKATFHIAGDIEIPVTDTTDYHTVVIDMIPRSAIIVQSGADASTAFYDTVLTLPMTSYVANLLGAFFFDPATAQIPDPVNPPAAQDIADAVNGFETALSVIRDFDLNESLVSHLNGSYAFALLPRPNNPAPFTGLPYDLLLVVEVDDGDAALDGALELARSVLALEDTDFEEQIIEGVPFQTLLVTPIREPLIQLGVVDNMLVIGTGSAADAAVRAGTGDNRLVNVERWQNVNPDTNPGLYVDLNGVYNTFIPTAGGATQQGVGQLSASAQYFGDGMFQIDVTVNVPQ